MAGPPDLPTVRHYADGRQVLVTSLAEFDALEPGHADTPSGPFPEPPAAGWEVPRDPTWGDDVALGHDARRRYVAGQSQQTIADALGVSRHTVRKWLAEDEPCP